MYKVSSLFQLQLLVMSLSVGVSGPDKTIEDGLLSLNSGRITYSEFINAPYFNSAKLIAFIEREPDSVLSESGITVLGFVKERAAVKLLFKLMLHSDQVVSRLACNALDLCAQSLRPVVDEERDLIWMIQGRCRQLIDFYVDGHEEYHPRILQTAVLTLLQLRYSEDESNVDEAVPKSIARLFESGLLPFRTYQVLISRMRSMKKLWIQDLLGAERDRVRQMFGPEAAHSRPVGCAVKIQSDVAGSQFQSDSE